MLTLTSKDLKREAVHAAKTVGVGGGAAAAGAIAARALTAGSRSYFVPLAVTAGGAFVAIKARGPVIPYIGVGAAVGGLWSLFDRSASPFSRGGW
jgi:ApbE superfamily uncharacterized protein (UPF0280 family)